MNKQEKMKYVSKWLIATNTRERTREAERVGRKKNSEQERQREEKRAK